MFKDEPIASGPAPRFGEFSTELLSDANAEAASRAQQAVRAPKPYVPPKLVNYGDVRLLTQSGSGKSNESAAGNPCTLDTTKLPCNASDRRLKERVARVGEHPLGFGLYLFSYKAGFGLPDARQFGVMADEVERVIPEAVSIDENGYQRVDYGLIGLHRN